MKKTLITTFIILILTGCSANNSTLKNTVSPEQKVQNIYKTVSPSKEKFFLNSNEGWKASYEPAGGFYEEMILYKTNDGGKTWNEIANSKINGSSLPGGNKQGMSFISSTKGWITVDTPWEGRVDLYMTSDGGLTWNEQKPQVPNEYQKSDMYTIPPLFFSTSNGILLSFASENAERIPLFYITHDGGENWILSPNKDTGISDGVKWDFTRGTPGRYEVTYSNCTWFLDGATWIKKEK